MTDPITISKQQPSFPEYLNFQSLREIGIRRLQALSSDLWTDYNLHDPGVTILEVLCYAITDLGYRNNFEIQDLLALNPKDSERKENNFFTPDEILTCNPVTDLDLRKRIIDIPGVRNVQFEKVGVPKVADGPVFIPYEPAIEIDLPNRELRYRPLQEGATNKETSESVYPRLHPRGLYTVCLDLDSQYRKDACGYLTRDWSSTIDEVKQVLCATRSLGEDIYDIELLGEEEIGLCADIQLEPGANAEDVLVEIYVQVQAFLSPRLRFYTLQELLKKGKSPAEIFAGRPMSLKHPERPYWNEALSDRTYASHGFIDTEELAALTPPTRLHTSDLYQVVLDVPGVAAVQKLTITNYINGLRQSQGHPWILPLTPGYRPGLGIQQSIVRISVDDLPAPVDQKEVIRRYYEQQSAYIKAIRDPYELNLSVPEGRHYDLADYYSIHHEFPLTYGIGEDGLPESAPILRKVQAQQLKGYLVFFDQLLANYLVQLSQVRELFSWESDTSNSRTYFTQAIDFPGVESILQGVGENNAGEASSEAAYLDAIAEDPKTYRDRRSRFLDHILARFAESFTDYTLLNYQLFENEQSRSQEKLEQQIIRDKTRFFQNYPLLSHDRFRGFNYCDCDEVWDTGNISGFQRRVASLLGFQNDYRRDLNHYHVASVSGEYVLSLRCNASGPSLVSTARYDAETTALKAQADFLRVMLHPRFYARLTYRSFYQYGWEVRCAVEGEIFTLRYDRYFPSRNQRQQALEPLIATIEQAFQQLMTDAEPGASPVAEAASAMPTPPTEPNIPDGRPQPTVMPSAEGLERLPRGLITPVVDESRNCQLQIVIPISEGADSIRFTGDRVYPSQEAANAAGEIWKNALLTAIRQSERYCGVVLLSRERTAQNEEKKREIDYFGYALKGVNNQVMAEPSLIDHEGERVSGRDRFISPEIRDITLQQWCCHLEANQDQFEFRLVPAEDEWQFQLVSLDESDDTERAFVSRERYSMKAAWEAATKAAASLRYRCRYIDLTTPPDMPLVGVVDEHGIVLMEARNAQDLDSLFKQFNNLDTFLQIDAVDVPIRNASVIIPFALPDLSDEAAETVVQYRYRLVGRACENKSAAILLQSIETYVDEETARDRFYQDGLSVLFDPGTIFPTQKRDGFGFQLLSEPCKPRTRVAENAQIFATEEARDDAIEQLMMLVRTARYTIAAQPYAQFLSVEDSVSSPDDSEQTDSEQTESTSNALPKFVGQLQHPDGSILLQGRQGYRKEETAWQRGDIWMELIQEQKNFRIIEGDGIYGWELTNPEKDQIWARHYHACEAERTETIDSLQRIVDDEGFYVLEHILLRPRSQQLSLSQKEDSEDAVDTVDSPIAEGLDTDSVRVVPSYTPTPDARSRSEIVDKLLPIIVKPDDAQYPATDPDRLARQDPYSFWVTVVLPYWPKRFRDVDFRRFVERTLRLEAPAHIALKITWVSVSQLHQFQTDYQTWLEQLAQQNCQGTACDFTPSLNRLIDSLSRLRNVYPKATLHNCNAPASEDSLILLNRTAI